MGVGCMGSVRIMDFHEFIGRSKFVAQGNFACAFFSILPAVSSKYGRVIKATIDGTGRDNARHESRWNWPVWWWTGLRNDTTIDDSLTLVAVRWCDDDFLCVLCL